MAVTDVSDVDESISTPTDTSEHASRAKIACIVAAVASVVPFFWAAIRDARNGFYPTLDVAATVLRARDTLSRNPPLIGMWSSGSSWAGHEIHFPGATELYLLAIPSHVLGTTWGPLLTMATLNAAWVLLAGWLIYRRLGYHGALVGFCFLNAFIWSIGSENLIDPRPMEMVTIPFLCFLFAVWAVASDDIDVLPALAVVANYLYLNHLVLALQIPVIGTCAIVGVVLWFRRTRSEDEAAMRAERKRLRRRLLQAGAITVILWLPSLIQELRGHPGNLTLLVRASGHDRNPVGSLTAGYNAMISLIAIPKFWFRGRFGGTDWPNDVYHLHPPEVIAGLVVLAGFAILGTLAWKRRDHLGLWALVIAVIAMLISVVTVAQAPATWGFPVQYLRSLWGLACFVWFAFALNILRSMRATSFARCSYAFGAAALIFAVMALSYADFGSAVDMEHAALTRRFLAKSIPQLTGRGPVYVTSAGDFDSQRYYSALLLGLAENGVQYCVPTNTAEQYGKAHACWARSSKFVHVEVGPTRPAVGPGRVLVKLPTITTVVTPAQRAEMETAQAYLRTHHRIEITPIAKKLLRAMTPERQALVNEVLEPADGDLTDSFTNPLFALLLGAAHAHQVDPKSQARIIADPEFPLDAMLSYQKFLTEQADQTHLWLVTTRKH